LLSLFQNVVPFFSHLLSYRRKNKKKTPKKVTFAGIYTELR